MQIRFRVLLGVLLATSLTAERARACDMVDGHPRVTERWLLDPDETPSYLGDDTKLVLIAGVRLPDGRDAVHHFPSSGLDFWPRTEGLVHSGGTWTPPADCPGCTFTPGTGWYFGVQHHEPVFGGGVHGPLLVQVLSVDRDCFQTDAGDGQATMGVGDALEYPITAYASSRSDHFPFPVTGCIDDESTAPAFPDLKTAVVTLTDFSLPGDGFGESFEVQQGTAGQSSQVYVHDGYCEGEASVRVTASGFALYSGVEPPRFIGPRSGDAPIEFGGAGSYVSQTVDSFQIFTPMARQDQAICYLVGLGGHFVYDTERAYITSVSSPEGPRWALVAQSFDTGSVSAKANCVAYDQRAFYTPPVSRPAPRPPGPVVRP